jgi:Flp pilus assembly protein TadG
MFNPMTALIACLRRFIARREGNTAIIFGLAAIPVVVAAGMAVDVTRAYMVKERLSAALDAASLAVGSEGGLTAAQLQTELTNYFFANYPSTALGRNITVTPLDTTSDTNASLAATIVNYQAQATVDMSFMSLVGVSNITVTALAQTHRGYGLEVALVLDNTGSMLCGPNDGAPSYANGSCPGSVDTSDTNCTDSSNQSRICTLRNASLQFLTTMTSAITSSGQLYIGVVPYVTTVNVGPTFCTGSFTCNNMTADSCSGDFTDDSNNIVAFPNGVLGTLSNGSKNVSSLNNSSGDTNHPSNTGDASVNMQVRAVNADSSVVNPPPSTPPIPVGTTISSETGAPTPTAMALSANANSSGTFIIQTGFTGKIAAGVISNISPALNTWNNVIPVGEVVTDNQTDTSTTPAYTAAGPSIPANTAVKSVSVANNTITLCNTNASSSGSTVTIWTYDPIPYDPNSNTPLGNGTDQSTESWMGCVIEPTSSDENSGVSGVINSSIADPDVSEPNVTEKWYPFWWRSGQGGFDGGINNWLPKSGGILGQTSTTEVQGAVTTDWDKFSGPNQGCPVPLLPLQDATTSAGQTAVQNTINAMWPRDAGGTQVAIGMIWGWRVLSPNGPFPSNGGHPLSYANQATLAWKKAIILMTDGTEEWPESTQDTGLSYISDGKAGTTSTNGCIDTTGGFDCTQATTNLGSRLATVCNNMKASGNFVIYTIGLGSDGASNTELQNCATPDGGFYPATPSNITTVFQSIANSLLTLRLSQ